MSSSEDDKTRIKSRPGQPKSPEEQKSLARDKQEMERRRLAAQKKARELEKRLAAMPSDKKSESASVKSPSAKGKTRAQSQQKAEPDKTVIKSKTPAQPQVDKTRIQTKPTVGSADKTEFKNRPKAKSPQLGPQDETKLDDSTTVPDVIGGRAKHDPAHQDHAGQQLLKKRFVFEEVLGAGGMGVVYKAKDLLKVEAQDRDPYVAIKVLSDDFKSHPEAFIALQRESRKTQRIAHPNIVNVHDFDRDGDTVFMTMEYLNGTPLDKLISQYKATGIPEEDAWKILEGICAALIYAHDQSIIHSDFKPGNIFVTKDNLAKVFDFGIARAVASAEVHEESTDDKTVFDAGNLGALTPAYASLEMLEGKTPDVRDDIFALGCIAYEMFTGNHPYNRVHADEAMQRKMKPKRITNISKRQWRVIEKSLAFKREDRIDNVWGFWNELTLKRGPAKAIAISSVVFLSAVIGLLAYQNYFGPKLSDINEAEIRGEIEREVLVSQSKKTLTELLYSPEFTEAWERNLANTFETLEGLLGKNDPWILEQKSVAFKGFMGHIVELIAQEEFERAREIVELAQTYGSDEERMSVLSTQIDTAEKALAIKLEEERKKKKQQAASRAKAAEQQNAMSERNKAFDVAMETVNKQLKCRSSMNMGDIDIAVGKLRSLNPSRYKKAEGAIVSDLAACVSKIGRSFPERAEEFKKRALRIFPKNRIVANIKIEPKDPCDTSLAGLGARGSRAMCRDTLKSEGEAFGKGPSMVVVPAKGSLKAFAIGKYEITYEDFNKFCENSAACSATATENEKLPVTNISATLMQQYADWLGLKSKRKYRLPSKAEWMYAARANSNKLDSNRNCRLDSRGIKKGGVLIKASTGQQNPWGLVNYLGNAQELALERGSFFAMGGTYETPIEECVASKSMDHSGSADKFTGFRLLREIAQKK
ncbi:MAG: protein kinase [Agarilytica sp.]